MNTKAYDLESMEHGDCSYTECVRILKNGISEKHLEPKNFEWVDSDGYTCSTWRIVYKVETKASIGMSLEEAKEYLHKRNQEEIFGHKMDELLAKQYK